MSETPFLWETWGQTTKEIQSYCVNLGRVAGKGPQLRACECDGQSGSWMARQGSFLNNTCHPTSEKRNRLFLLEGTYSNHQLAHGALNSGIQIVDKYIELALELTSEENHCCLIATQMRPHSLPPFEPCL